MTFVKNLPLQKQQYLPVSLVLVCALIAYIFNSELSPNLVFQQPAITDGQYWRIFTGHFFHTNLNHLLLNLGGLILLWSLHGRYYTLTNYTSLFLVSAIITSLGIYFFSPQIQQYVGLSGVLHGIFVWGAIKDIKHGDKTGYLLFSGVWLKIIHEQVYGASAETVALINANVAIDAHLYGAIGGSLVILFGCIKLKKI